MSEKEEITLDKFKAWLEGVEEMQDDNWFPTAVQWNKIREKIDLIGDGLNGYVPVQVARQQPAVQQNMVVPPQSALDDGYHPISEGHTQADPPSEYGRPNGPTSSFTGEPGAPPVTTPNIDTSESGYSSSFA